MHNGDSVNEEFKTVYMIFCSYMNSLKIKGPVDSSLVFTLRYGVKPLHYTVQYSELLVGIYRLR